MNTLLLSSRSVRYISKRIPLFIFILFIASTIMVNNQIKFHDQYLVLNPVLLFTLLSAVIAVAHFSPNLMRKNTIVRSINTEVVNVCIFFATFITFLVLGSISNVGHSGGVIVYLVLSAGVALNFVLVALKGEVFNEDSIIGITMIAVISSVLTILGVSSGIIIAFFMIVFGFLLKQTLTNV